MTLAELDIDSIAAGGDGVGRTDGVVVFVPRTAPGDRVRVGSTCGDGSRAARWTRCSRRRPTARRRSASTTWPTSAAGASCSTFATTPSSRRNSASFAIRSRASASATSTCRPSSRVRASGAIAASSRSRCVERRGRATSGRSASARTTIPTTSFRSRDCPITDERVLAVWRKAVAAARRLLPDADELRGAVQLLGDDVSVVDARAAHAWPDRTRVLRGRAGGDVALVAAGASRAQSGGIATTGANDVRDASASFAQVNAEVGASLHAYVLERARSHRPATVVDAYAGAGATAAPLAQATAPVSPPSRPIATRPRPAPRPLAPFAGSRAVTARVEDVIGRRLPADVVLLNPPRAGLHERVTARCIEPTPAPRAVIYVSCDPATLARDLTRLPRFASRRSARSTCSRRRRTSRPCASSCPTRSRGGGRREVLRLRKR